MTASGNIIKKLITSFSKVFNPHLEPGPVSEITSYLCPSEFAFTLKIVSYL